MEYFKSSAKKTILKITNRRKSSNLAHPYLSGKSQHRQRAQRGLPFGDDAVYTRLLHTAQGLTTNAVINLESTDSPTEVVTKPNASTESVATSTASADSTLCTINEEPSLDVSEEPSLDVSESSSQMHDTIDDDKENFLDISTPISRHNDSVYNSTFLSSCQPDEVEVSAVQLLFPTGVLPANVINPLQTPSKLRRQTSTSNLFTKFRRRAGRTKIFTSFRGRNGSRLSDPVKSSDDIEVDTNTNLRHSAAIDANSAMANTNAASSKDSADSTAIEQSVTNDMLQPPDSLSWSVRDMSPDRTITPSCDEPLHDVGIIPPPTPFRLLVTPSEKALDTECVDSTRDRKISSDLKKEIELSLLHWPNKMDSSEHSYSSLKRPASGSKTLAQISDSNRGLSLPGRNTGRPLSWSYDLTDASNIIAPVTSSVSNQSIGRADSSSHCSPTPASSCTTIGELDTFPTDDSYNTLASEEFGDAVTALRTFSGRKHSYTRDSRRMSQPHPIKLRNRLPSKHSVSSLQFPQAVIHSTRIRSKSEPARLVHDNIRQNFSKELAKICPAVGDIASLESHKQRHIERPSLTIADPLWHHVTNESEELSFRVGDVIMVLDKSDKDWWWGRRSPSSTFSPDDSTDQQDTGWFPATFVRLRANQEVTTDELLEDIKQGTANTASVVQQYGSSLLSRDQARCNVINEIITAEREYVKHLQDIVEGFKGKATERTDMFTERQVSLIFGNISEIYEVAKDFLEKLETAVDPCQSVHLALVGACFLQHKEKFAIYSPYCNNHPRALEELQKLNKDTKYIQFFEACRLLQNMIELPLDGFLLTPIQKICKYPLQLAELLKYTSVEHADYTHLQEALAAMKDIAMLINERKRKLESIQSIAEWQSGVDDWQGDDLLAHSSELIHYGELCKLSSSGRLVERHFFLFDNQLVQCKKELLKKSLIYKSRVLLHDHSVVPIEDGKVNNSSTYAKNGFELRDQTGSCVLFLSAKSSTEKEKWLKCFHKEREIVQYDRDSGFAVTEAFMALAKLSTPSKTVKPNKTNSLGRSEKTSATIMDNNNKLPVKQKSGNGLIHKLKRARITT